MQKYFKCHQCGKRFIAEDDLSVQCPDCGSFQLQPVSPRKGQPWMYPAAFILFLAIGFGVSEIVRPKLFAVTSDEINKVGPQVPAEVVDEIVDEPTIIEEPGVSDPQPVVTPDPKPVVTPEPKPVVNPEPKPVVTPEPKPVVNPEPKPVPTPEPKPVTTPEPAPTAEPVNHMSKSEVQSIVARGALNAKIPRNCNIILNGTPTDYSNFCMGVRNGSIKEVQVKDVSFDSKGTITKIVVSGTEKHDDDYGY